METINKNKNFFLCDKYYNVYYSEPDKKNKIDNVSRKNNDNSNNVTNDFEEKNNDSNIYFFARSDKKYTEEELLKMNIYEISIGFHPTKISNNELISFHPFFYLKIG